MSSGRAHHPLRPSADGLVRLCTQPYVRPTDSNLECAYMHLTNYAINKKNENFEFNEDEESGDKGAA